MRFECFFVGPLDRTGGLPWAALLEVPLQELVHQLLAPPVQLPFEVALTHLPGFARTEEGFGLCEGGRRRIRHLVGESGAVGDGSHRSTLPQPPLRIAGLQPPIRAPPPQQLAHGARQLHPAQARTGPHNLAAQHHLLHAEGTSREPRRRCGDRRGISLPTTPYQNAARMSSRGAGGERPKRPGAATIRPGCLPEKRRVGAVPAQIDPKGIVREHKTPMNRRKSALRRRAAPIGDRPGQLIAPEVHMSEVGQVAEGLGSGPLR